MGSNPPEYSHFMSVCSLRAASVSTLMYLECIRGWEVKQYSGEEEGGGDGSVSKCHEATHFSMAFSSENVDTVKIMRRAVDDADDPT